MALMLVSSIQGKATARVLRVLFDSGGTGSMAHRRVCPPGTEVTPTPTRQVNTLAGHLSSSGKIEIQGMRLPEFDRNRVIDSHEFGTFDTPCQYDLILGTEFLAKMGIKLDYEKLQVEWLGIVRPMNTNKFTAERRRSLVGAYLLQMEDDDELDDLACYATAVMDAKYEAIEADDIIQQQCSHLTAEQQNDLRILFAERKKLFDGTLGKFEGAPMHIELEDNARPVYRRPYPVPHSLRDFQKRTQSFSRVGSALSLWRESMGLTYVHSTKEAVVRRNRRPSSMGVGFSRAQQGYQASQLYLADHYRHPTQAPWISIFQQARHFDAVLHLRTYGGGEESLCHQHAFWQLQVQPCADGTSK